MAACAVIGSASAEYRFDCGDAQVEVSVETIENPLPELRRRAKISVSHASGAVRELSYIGGIDYIGGHCVHDRNGQPYVLFQAVCGGSACKDLENWGIIDPRSMQLLLAPNDMSRAEAERILGKAPVTPKNMLRVDDEAEIP